MHYQVSRNGQMYGPYTLDDLRRYVASGNVLPTDLCKSEEMPDWQPVSQVLGATGAAPAPGDPTNFSQPVYGQPAFGQPGYDPSGAAAGAPAYPGGYNPALAASAFPDPPNLHWGLVLLFTILTCGLFIIIWNLIVSAWLRRVQPTANALFLYIAAYVLALLNGGLTVAPAMRQAMHPGMYTGHTSLAAGGLGILVWVLRLVARFSERSSLEQHYNGPEPLGLQLNPVMVFFFGGLYIQSQLNRVNGIKQAARLGMGRGF